MVFQVGKTVLFIATVAMFDNWQNHCIQYWKQSPQGWFSSTLVHIDLLVSEEKI